MVEGGSLAAPVALTGKVGAVEYGSIPEATLLMVSNLLYRSASSLGMPPTDPAATGRGNVCRLEIGDTAQRGQAATE